jgi:hypothetical protein
MELEDLKRRWEEQDRKLDAGLRLNTRLLQASVLGKAETSLRGLSRLLWFELLTNLLVAFWVGSFLANHLSEPRFLIPAAALHLCVIALLAAGARQLVALKTIDYSAPIVTIQKRLESLRVERIRAVTLTFLFSPLLWTPLMIVALKAFLGVDAYAAFGAPFLIANLLFGLLFLSLAVWISKRYEARMKRSPLIQCLMRTLACNSLASAAAFVRSISEFEKDESRP